MKLPMCGGPSLHTDVATNINIPLYTPLTDLLEVTFQTPDFCAIKSSQQLHHAVQRLTPLDSINLNSSLRYFSSRKYDG